MANTWDDNYVILLTTVTAAMLEVSLVASVVNLRGLTNRCVLNYTPVEKHGLRITWRIFRFPHFSSVFAHI